SLGCGIVVAQIADRTGSPRAEPFPGTLVLPVGFAAVVVIASLLTTWKTTAPLTGVAPAVVAVAGLVTGRHRIAGWWRARRSALWPLIAAAMPAASVAAPVVLTGKAGFTGFARITDLAHQVAFTEWLRTEGRTQIGAGNSSFQEIVDKLVTSSYPGGSQSVIAAMGDLARVDVIWAYQPVLAFIAAMLGLSLYVVLRRAIPGRLLCAVAAGVAAQPTILYAYTLAAGIKELSGAAALLIVVAVFAERRPVGWSVLVPGAVALAAAYSIFSLTIIPWLGMALAVLAVFELARERERGRTVVRWAGVVGLTALLAAPAVVGGVTLLRAAGGANGPEGLGNLAAPVPAWASVGPWITPDHRFPIERYGLPTLTYVLIAVALVLVPIGFAAAARARDRGLVTLGVAGAVALAFMLYSSGTWLQLKAFCMTAPVTLALAFAGAAWLMRRMRFLQVAGLLAGGAVALGVLYGNALQYRHTPVADYTRMIDLKEINAKYAGRGPTLFPNFDEYAEYLLRDARGSGLVNPWRSIMTYNRTATPGLQTIRDTDEYEQHFLQGFRLIVRRRDPSASRPPSNWRLAETTREYEVWRRVSDPSRIAAHFPLDGSSQRRSARFCRRVDAAVQKVGPGARIAYALPKPDLVRVEPDPRAKPAFWGRQGNVLFAGAPGRWKQPFVVPATGTYSMLMGGSVGRKITISVDGREVRVLRWRESYQGQYIFLANLRLTRGTHTLAVFRPGGNLLPGTGNDSSGTTTRIGPVLLDPAWQQQVVRSAPASRLAAVCGSQQRLDWLEVWRPSGGSG
ncbi:MAG: hypothetical protein QOH46_1390, partial [Solirubrobacteraceae bacterium]|nr:hypothetical protein [Solirubrobacteraceae bacterium]